jgi:hypothetical protein
MMIYIHHKFKDDRMMSSSYIWGENSSPKSQYTIILESMMYIIIRFIQVHFYV